MLTYMRKIILLLTVLSLFGIGCKTDGDTITAEKIQQALEKTAEDYGWAGGIISREPSEENFYSDSYILYGPAKESGLENVIDSVEVMQFKFAAEAQKNYKNDSCMKGNGAPFTIAGITGCCLNDVKNGTSEAVMAKDEFIFKAVTYFRAECGAVDYLKKFWKKLQ